MKNILLVLSVVAGLTPYNHYSPGNMVYEADHFLKFRSCFTAQIGGDYLKTVINTMVDQYIERYNSERFTEEIRQETGEVRNLINHLTHPPKDFEGNHYKLKTYGNLE